MAHRIPPPLNKARNKHPVNDTNGSADMKVGSLTGRAQNNDIDGEALNEDDKSIDEDHDKHVNML